MIEELPPRLAEIVKRASSLVGSVESTQEGENVFTMEDVLRSVHQMEEENREKRIQINKILSELKEFYGSVPASKKDADAKLLILDTGASAYLTLIPPHPSGRLLTPAEVLKEVERRGIKHQVNSEAIFAACEKVSKKKEMIYMLKIAQCTLPEKGEPASIDYKVRYLNKLQIFDENVPFEGDLGLQLESVNIGKLVACMRPAGPGKAGINVRGEEIPPLRGKGLDIEFGEGLKIAPNGRDVCAISNGCLVLDEYRLDIIPFYLVEGDLREGEDINFGGNVFVKGDVKGPLVIDAEDVYICGNLEDATIYAKGDVFIKGSFLGKRSGFIESEGKVFARSISDARVNAMRDVVVRNSITYSDVSSNSKIKVIAEKGAIIGGTLCALKEIIAKTIGSDFGTYTTTIVGKDFLTSKRLSDLEAKIKEYEIWLAKIELLKKRLSAERPDLASQKQDVYVAILQKELRTRTELSGLKRSKERFDRTVTEFLDASIQILEEVFPPVKVQIVDAIEEIREKLHQVTLVLDRENMKVRTKSL